MGQSIVLIEIKAEVSLENNLPSHQNLLLQDTEEQFFTCACRETLFQEMTDHHNQKDGFKETRELDPYWKSRPVVYTTNMEVKLESGL